MTEITVKLGEDIFHQIIMQYVDPDHWCIVGMTCSEWRKLVRYFFLII